MYLTAIKEIFEENPLNRHTLQSLIDSGKTKPNEDPLIVERKIHLNEKAIQNLYVSLLQIDLL